MKITIGAPTYNDHERIERLFQSILTFTDFPEEDYQLVMIDDGTKKQVNLEGLKNLSKTLNIPLILNEKNRGIPYCWNRLTEYYDTEYVILFNDDIQIKNRNWLKCFIYFMENNPHAGNIGFPLLHIDGTGNINKRYDPPNEDVPPGRVGSPVGCAFGFRKELWKKIKNPDGSIGFYEDLVSFYEEISFGFEISKMGYYCYMLPTPSMEHWGSQTFSNNPELTVREISKALPKEEYLKAMALAQKPSLPYKEHRDLAEKDLAYRMDYSRMLFAKLWHCMDKWDLPQLETHRAIIDKMDPKMTKWLDREGNAKESIV